MKPRLSYTIWFSQRTGSTVLCKALESTGIAGKPNEWLYTGDGNLLDTTLVLYGSGLNNGDGFKNGTGAHSNDKMPLLLAGGRGLGIAGDRHIKIDDGSVPATNLHLAMLHALGLRLPSFSDSTGSLAGLT